MASGHTDRQPGTLPGAPPERERRPGLRAAGGAATRIAGQVLARRGGGTLGRLKAAWNAIAGGELAANAWPEALSRTGALKLRVVPGFALELQHLTPIVIERINRFFGRSVVARIVLVQGPLPLAPATPVERSDSLSIAEETALDASLVEIADPALRAALAGLGRLVLGRRRDR